MDPVIAKITADVEPAEAFETTRKLDMEHMPVVSSAEENEFTGILNCRTVRRSLSAEVLLRQEKADNVHSARLA